MAAATYANFVLGVRNQQQPDALREGRMRCVKDSDASSARVAHDDRTGIRRSREALRRRRGRSPHPHRGSHR